MSATLAGGRRHTAGAAAGAVVGMLPVALIGAQAPLLLDEFGHTEALLGLSVSSYFGAAALSSLFAGRLSRRVHPQAMIRGASLLSASVLLGIAVSANGWPLLAAMAALGGVANAFVHVGGNQLLAVALPPHRHGLAYGVKQSAIPLAAFLGGLSLPAIGLTVGWRWAFAAASLGALIPLTLTSRRVSLDEPPIGESAPRLRALAPLTLTLAAAACASAAGNSLTPFLAASAVNRGFTANASGVLLAMGAAAGVLTRLGAGIVADKWRVRALTIMATLLWLGVGGFALLAYAGTSAVWFASGTLLAYAGGWGWAGVLVLAVVRSDRRNAGASMGYVATGPYVGAVIGPAVFGFLAEHAAYEVGWLFLGLAAAIGAILSVVSRAFLVER